MSYNLIIFKEYNPLQKLIFSRKSLLKKEKLCNTFCINHVLPLMVFIWKWSSLISCHLHIYSSCPVLSTSDGKKSQDCSCDRYLTYLDVHTLHCIICSIVYALYSMHYILCYVFYALYSMQCILFIELYPYMHCSL